MIKLVSIVSLLLGSWAIAGVSEVPPNADMLSPATVERVITLKRETSRWAGVRLVQVDNGGSTDVSASLAPSRLYVTIHQDEEECDIIGNYLISPSIVRVIFAHLIGDELHVKYMFRDDEMKPHVGHYKIYLEDALAEAKKIKDTSDTTNNCVLQSTVGMQNLNP